MLPKQFYKYSRCILKKLRHALPGISAWLTSLLLSMAAYTQPNINRVEWYVDTDPGYGNATPISISAGPNLSNLNFSVNIVPLSEGVHIVGVRSRDANGAWSHDNKWLFVKPYSINNNTPVPNINRVEWFVDNDPGYGNGTPVTISPGADLNSLGFTVNFGPLSEGVHIVGVRSRDANGSWSHDNKWLFVKPYSTNANTPVPNINRVDWYVDNDPGYGNATSISISPGADLPGLGFQVNIPPLNEGVHIAGVRSRDANGSWSHDNKWLFVKPYSFNSTQTPNITKVEWYLDTDPGYGNGTQVAITPGTNLSGLSFTQNLNGLAPGAHIIGVRSQDAKGAWSHDNKWLLIKPFSSQPARLISQVEYYLDTDPGYGNGVPVALTAANNISGKEIIANISGLNIGKHYIFFRSRDDQKTWSFDYIDSFNISTPVAAPQVNINSIAKKFMCVRDSFDVGYDLAGVFNNGNIFSVFLSNAAGDFTNETQIGSASSIKDGAVRCLLPLNVPDGNGYKIRIKSSNPSLTSAATPFALNLYDKPFFANDTTVFAICGTDIFNLNTIFPSGGYTLNWNTLNPSAADTGTYRLIAINSNGCSDTVAVTIALDVARWTGAVSTNWHTAGNWNTNKVPNEKTHVIIEANKPFNCIISQSNALAASVQVKPGATLNVTNSRTVTISAACNALPN
jgi:hypothetical protein